MCRQLYCLSAHSVNNNDHYLMPAELILGFVLSIAFGSLFHLCFNGSAERLLTYLILSIVGFCLGNLTGSWLSFTWFQLGSLHLLTASIGAWVMLLTGRWLMGDE